MTTIDYPLTERVWSVVHYKHVINHLPHALYTITTLHVDKKMPTHASLSLTFYSLDDAYTIHSEDVVFVPPSMNLLVDRMNRWHLPVDAFIDAVDTATSNPSFNVFSTHYKQRKHSMDLVCIHPVTQCVDHPFPIHIIHMTLTSGGHTHHYRWLKIDDHVASFHHREQLVLHLLKQRDGWHRSILKRWIGIADLVEHIMEFV